jgi:hypothetical protein
MITSSHPVGDRDGHRHNPIQLKTAERTNKLECRDHPTVTDLAEAPSAACKEGRGDQALLLEAGNGGRDPWERSNNPQQATYVEPPDQQTNTTCSPKKFTSHGGVVRWVAALCLLADEEREKEKEEGKNRRLKFFYGCGTVACGGVGLRSGEGCGWSDC